MTGYDIIKRAMNLLGYSANGDDPDRAVGEAAKGIQIVNQLLLDLNYGDIVSLSDSLEISHSAEDALCYGAAMLLAVTEGDSEKNRFFAEIYNAKRSAALAKTDTVKDCLPKVTVG